jgi:hypothetical protein
MAIEARQDPPPHITQKSAVEARQGVISGRVVLVLATSLSLAVIALCVTYWTMY